MIHLITFRYDRETQRHTAITERTTDIGKGTDRYTWSHDFDIIIVIAECVLSMLISYRVELFVTIIIMIIVSVRVKSIIISFTTKTIIC